MEPENLSLKMSELTEGMVIEYYGMELLLTDRHERELRPSEGDIAESLKAAGHPPKTYWFTGVVQNTEEVDAMRIVPPSWRRDGKWQVQGNDLVRHHVIKIPVPTNNEEA